MENAFDLLKIAVICFTILVVTFFILLALPQSKFRSVVLELFGWGSAGAAAVGLVSPIDMVPDLIPLLGQADDIGYILVGLASALIAYRQHKSRRKITD